MVNFYGKQILARSPAVNAGVLRHNLTFSAYTLSSPDEFGNTVRNYSVVYTCMGNVKENVEQQVSYGQSFLTQSTHTIFIRYDPAFTPAANQTIKADNITNTYTVVGVENFEDRNAFYVIKANFLGVTNA